MPVHPPFFNAKHARVFAKKLVGFEERLSHEQIFLCNPNDNS